MGKVNGTLSEAHTPNLLMHPNPLMQTYRENVFPTCTFEIQLKNKQRCVETDLNFFSSSRKLKLQIYLTLILSSLSI